MFKWPALTNYVNIMSTYKEIITVIFTNNIKQ